MRAGKLFLALTLLLPEISAGADLRAAKTLCRPDERIVFSCPVKRKTISVCSSQILGRETGYLQYRFGVVGKSPELVYPAAQGSPSNYFKYSESEAAKWSLRELHFDSGPYSYAVFAKGAAFMPDGAGVIVRKGDSKVVNLVCALKDAKNNLDQLDKIGLPETKEISVDDVLE